MSETVVEVVYGKHAKYEVVRKSNTFSTDIVLRKDGNYVGTFSNVQAAVDAAKKKG
jgi:hypothetical protein